MQDFKYIGKYVPLHDIEQKVTGRLKYVDDIVLPNMLYAKLILSSVAHGNIKNIDINEAQKLEGVVGIYTYKNSIQKPYNSHKWIDGMKGIEDERLFSDKSRYFGDRIGAVVAESKYIAQRAVNLIKVEYEKLPVVLEPEDALKEDSPKIHENGNFVCEKQLCCGDVEKAFEDAPIIVEDYIQTPKIHHAAMEPHTCIVDIDAFDNLTVYSPCQSVFQVQHLISDVLDIPQNKIRVIKTPMGGSFGGKGHPILEPICAFLALKHKRAVKLTMDRREAILSTRTRTKTIGKVKTAVDSEGNIIAREINMLVDTGAYLTNGEAVAVAMGKKSFRLYKVKNQRYTSKTVYTNTPVGGAARGYGSPQIHVLTEVNIDNVARKLNMDPLKLRLKNLVQPYDKDPIGGPDLGNARIIDCLIEGAKIFNWEEKYNRKKDSGRYLKGVGMACCAHGNGYFGAYADFTTVSIRLAGDGTVLVKGAFHDMGCGTITTMKQIVAEALSIDINCVYIPEADTFVSPFDSAGTQASRVTFVCGGAALKAAEKLKEKLKNYGAKILDCSLEDVVVENGFIWNKNKDSFKLSYKEAATIIQRDYSDEAGCVVTYKSLANPASYGVNFAEVEVDRVSGMVRVIEIVSVHDIGRAINKEFAKGQIQGAIQMGIGMALCEEFTFDNEGRITSDGFGRYHVINAPDMPNIKIHLIEKLEDNGPYGAKSIGEIATVPTAPAIINAINNALDININVLPATPKRIIEFLKNK